MQKGLYNLFFLSVLERFFYFQKPFYTSCAFTSTTTMRIIIVSTLCMWFDMHAMRASLLPYYGLLTQQGFTSCTARWALFPLIIFSLCFLSSLASMRCFPSHFLHVFPAPLFEHLFFNLWHLSFLFPSISSVAHTSPSLFMCPFQFPCFPFLFMCFLHFPHVPLILLMFSLSSMCFCQFPMRLSALNVVYLFSHVFCPFLMWFCMF